MLPFRRSQFLDAITSVNRNDELEGIWYKSVVVTWRCFTSVLEGKGRGKAVPVRGRGGS
jgi:hypothetical protein